MSIFILGFWSRCYKKPFACFQYPDQSTPPHSSNSIWLLVVSIKCGSNKKKSSVPRVLKKIIFMLESKNHFEIPSTWKKELELMIKHFCFCRTRCADENEEEITEQEIQTMFPNYATTDFGEFIQNPTLETNQIETAPKPNPVSNLLTDEDLKFIGDLFIDIMFKYSRSVFLSNISTIFFVISMYLSIIQMSIHNLIMCPNF